MRTVAWPAGLVVDTADTLTGPAGSAVLSPCRTWRYALRRTWDDTRDAAVFIMLNPSTADGVTDDATIRRCVRFATTWRLGGILVVNLFGLRSRDPKVLPQHPDPVGPDNDPVLTAVVTAGAGPVVAAWGATAFAARAGRDRTVLNLLGGHGIPVACLGTTGGGHPRHPLFVRAVTPLRPYPDRGTRG